MAQELYVARQSLSQIQTHLKQGKLLSALQTVQSAVKSIAGTPLMKAEQEELKNLLNDACSYISMSPAFKEISPLHLSYTVGSEADLLSQLTSIIETQQKQIEDDFQSATERLLEKKAAKLKKAMDTLARGEAKEALSQFTAIGEEFFDDAEIFKTIGEALLKYSMNDVAVDYLNKYLQKSPESATLYNHIAISLRKAQVFPRAEELFFKAIELEPKNSFIYFNLARLYLDQSQFDHAKQQAQKALELDKNFAEATKLLKYADKMLAAK